MIYHRKKGWELKESQTTAQSVFMNRRAFLASASGLAVSALAQPHRALASDAHASEALASDDIAGNKIAADLYPPQKRKDYQAQRALTAEHISASYNNFYEFGSHKRIAKAAQALKLSPWDIHISGEIDKPITIGIEDLIRLMGIEERIYRHRCVEAWAMTVPWAGFALSKLVKWAQPKSSAHFVSFQTFYDPKTASGQKQIWYPWPYIEGVTMKEALNDLAFMVTGVYGHPLQKQFGAPMRLALPWKYGFKSIKSITHIRFVKTRPVSFWEQVNRSEYGFWANVNPKVPHRRWSQASEELIGENRRVPTRLFNGYGDKVAHLYKGMDHEPLWQ